MIIMARWGAQHDSERNLFRGEESTSFLKKRSKKLFSVTPRP
jgi:hypothetical protein